MNIARKFLVFTILGAAIIGLSYILFMYYATFSEGVRSGELIKFSNKGYMFKTWEGEVSQGMSGSQIFKFSVLDNEKKVIDELKANQGKYVKVEYVERYGTFFWWGDTVYFITKVTPEKSPYFAK